MKIRQLSNTVINRIAAGEVLERPSSAVKELVENSIDAGATKILVEIEYGGQNFIKIQDNGCGMSKEDLLISIEPHTTSKLVDDDLFNISYFGFRGEALASICSVARVSILSKEIQNDCAHLLHVEAGEKKDIIPASSSVGTTIEVKDLFFATPARLKFLKSPKVEVQKIIEILERISIAHPNLNVRLVSDNKQIFDYVPVNNIKERLVQINGKESIDNLFDVDYKDNNISIQGFASVATYNFRTSEHINVYVNNRPVKDKLLIQAIRIAYNDVMPRDRYPFVTLFINIPSYEVDVNVHPSKIEVRFKDENYVKNSIIKSIKNNLLKLENNFTSTFLSENFINKIKEEQDNFVQQNFKIDSAINEINTKNNKDYNFNTTEQDEYIESNHAYKSFENEPVVYNYVDNSKTYPHSYEHISQQQVAYNNIQNNQKYKSDIDDKSKYSLGFAKCQIDKTYIIAEANDEMIIVDQHAAHERIVYEKYKSALQSDSIIKQKLLITEVIVLKQDDFEVIYDNRYLLDKLGIEINFFDALSLEILTLPSVLKDVDCDELIKNLAIDLKESSEAATLDQIIEHIYETIACHSSIRSGRTLNIVEMNDLLRQIENTQLSAQCNHGRPSFVKIKFKDIEKLFERS